MQKAVNAKIGEVCLLKRVVILRALNASGQEEYCIAVLLVLFDSIFEPVEHVFR